MKMKQSSKGDTNTWFVLGNIFCKGVGKYKPTKGQFMYILKRPILLWGRHKNIWSQSYKLNYLFILWNKFSLFIVIIFEMGALWHLQKFLHHSWIHPLHYSSLSFPTPIPGIVSAALIFPLSYINTYFHHIHPPTCFS
jgi:hypothetical protein